MNSITRFEILVAILIFAFAFSLFTNRGAEPEVKAQSTLTPSERRGKSIYLRGTSLSGGEILAYVGESSLEVPGREMACGNCHGADGIGKPEGGVSPSNIKWELLAKPYGLTHVNGRRHPPYTERALEFAITRGIDPAGNRLMNVMPRYQMSPGDLADLVAYLKRLGTEQEPGITADTIVIGTVVPETGPLVEMGEAVKAVITAFFAEINDQGGIYNRRVEVKIAATGADAKATRVNIGRLLKEDKIFALTGAFIAGAEKEVVPLLAEKEVPLIGPLTLDPQTAFPLNRHVFYLLSGSSGQARAAVNYIAKKPDWEKSRIAIVSVQSDLNSGVSEAIRDQIKKDSLTAPTIYGYAAGQFDVNQAVAQLRRANSDIVFFMGDSHEVLALLGEAERFGWFPRIFLSSTGLGANIFGAPSGFDGKLFLAFPTSPLDQSVAGLREFRAFAEKHKLPPKHLAAQVTTFSAAKVMTEALRRAGKDLTRERLIEVLESFYEYQTGLTRPITFGLNRRVGAAGAYIVTVDLKGKQLVAASGWIEIN